MIAADVLKEKFDREKRNDLSTSNAVNAIQRIEKSFSVMITVSVTGGTSPGETYCGTKACTIIAPALLPAATAPATERMGLVLSPAA